MPSQGGKSKASRGEISEALSEAPHETETIEHTAPLPTFNAEMAEAIGEDEGTIDITRDYELAYPAPDIIVGRPKPAETIKKKTATPPPPPARRTASKKPLSAATPESSDKRIAQTMLWLETRLKSMGINLETTTLLKNAGLDTEKIPNLKTLKNTVEEAVREIEESRPSPSVEFNKRISALRLIKVFFDKEKSALSQISSPGFSEKEIATAIVEKRARHSQDEQERVSAESDETHQEMAKNMQGALKQILKDFIVPDRAGDTQTIEALKKKIPAEPPVPVPVPTGWRGGLMRLTQGAEYSRQKEAFVKAQSEYKKWEEHTKPIDGQIKRLQDRRDVLSGYTADELRRDLSLSSWEEDTITSVENLRQEINNEWERVNRILGPVLADYAHQVKGGKKLYQFNEQNPLISPEELLHLKNPFLKKGLLQLLALEGVSDVLEKRGSATQKRLKPVDYAKKLTNLTKRITQLHTQILPQQR